jgi:hypothetical protein
VVVSD